MAVVPRSIEGQRAAREPIATDAGLVWIQLVAVVTMLLDHINWFWVAHGDDPQGASTAWMNDVGRIAFPLFAFAFAANLSRILHGPEPGPRWRRQAVRLALAGVLAQLAYWPLRGTAIPLNVMFTFLLSSLVIMAWRHAAARQDTIGQCAAFAATVVTGAYVEYAWFGVLTVLAAWGLNVSRRWYSCGGFLCALLGLCLINRSLYALGAAPLILLLRSVQTAPRRSRKALYVFYPGHLWLLLLLTS